MITAGVLIGGASTRMGACKALLSHERGGTWVEHVARQAEAVAARVVLLGTLPPGLAVPESLSGLEQISDARADAGPVAGLVSLLEAAGDGWGLLLACDLPQLEADVLRRIVAGAREGIDAAAWRADARSPWETCAAVYHVRLLDAAQRVLARCGGLQSVLQGCRVAPAALTPAQAATLRGRNRPADP